MRIETTFNWLLAEFPEFAALDERDWLEKLHGRPLYFGWVDLCKTPPVAVWSTEPWPNDIAPDSLLIERTQKGSAPPKK